MPYATYRFNKTIAADTIRFIVTVAIVVYKGLIPVVGRILTLMYVVKHSFLVLYFAIPDKINTFVLCFS